MSPTSTGLPVHESFYMHWPVGMSTKHVRTTGDLIRFGAALKVTYRDCGSAMTFNAVETVRPLAKCLAHRGTAQMLAMREASGEAEVLSPV